MRLRRREVTEVFGMSGCGREHKLNLSQTRMRSLVGASMLGRWSGRKESENAWMQVSFVEEVAAFLLRSGYGNRGGRRVVR
jgi:hypothetical protein